MTEIIYALRNPMEKGFSTATGYLWSSGWLYYSHMSELVTGGTPVREMSKRALVKMLGGEEELPGYWEIHPYIGLSPEYIVDMDAVRDLFPHPKDLQIAIVKDYEVFFQIAKRLGELTEYSKSELESIVSQVLQKRFAGRNLNTLSEADKGKLAIVLNREYGMSSYQISTTIYVKERIIRQVLASKEIRHFGPPMQDFTRQCESNPSKKA